MHICLGGVHICLGGVHICLGGVHICLGGVHVFRMAYLAICSVLRDGISYWMTCFT